MPVPLDEAECPDQVGAHLVDGCTGGAYGCFRFAIVRESAHPGCIG